MASPRRDITSRKAVAATRNAKMTPTLRINQLHAIEINGNALIINFELG